MYNISSPEAMATSTVMSVLIDPSGFSSVELLAVIIPSSIFLLICIILLLVCTVYCLSRVRTKKNSSKTVFEG